MVAGRDAAGVCRACRLPLGVSVLLSPGSQAIVTKSFAANCPSGGEVLIMLTVLSSLPRRGEAGAIHLTISAGMISTSPAQLRK